MKGGVLDAGNATAQAEQVEEMRYSRDFVVDVGNVEHTARTTQFHHWRHAA